MKYLNHIREDRSQAISFIKPTVSCANATRFSPFFWAKHTVFFLSEELRASFKFYERNRRRDALPSQKSQRAFAFFPCVSFDISKT